MDLSELKDIQPQDLIKLVTSEKSPMAIKRKYLPYYCTFCAGTIVDIRPHKTDEFDVHIPFKAPQDFARGFYEQFGYDRTDLTIILYADTYRDVPVAISQLIPAHTYRNIKVYVVKLEREIPFL